jgi:serine/threonine protein kinase
MITRRSNCDPTTVSAYTLKQQSQLTSLLDTYLTQLENGERPDESALLEAHPEIAEPLRVHLDHLRMLHEVVDTPAGDGSIAHYTAPKHLGNYELVREIGRGGMGIVYEAIDHTLHRQVALKVLPFAAVLDRKQIARFRNEAQAAAQLNHPNIVPVYSVNVDRGVHFYAMQYVDGRPLSDAISELRQRMPNPTGTDPVSTATESSLDNRPAPCEQPISNEESAPCESPRDISHRHDRSWASTAKNMAISTYDYPVGMDFFKHAARLGIQAAEGLQHAHGFGIVHRDIKPSNLLLDETGNIWIADFGLAHIPNDVSITATGDVLGTVRYMSPEQARGRGAFVDHRTDIYSLGLTLYELVTFQPAFSSSRRYRLSQPLAAEPPAARRINRAIPGDLETIIHKAMAREPSERYACAQALADDLRRFVEGRPTLARRPSLVDRLAKWSRRHRRAVVAAAGALIIATCGSAIGLVKIAAERNRTATALAVAEDNLQQSQTNFRAARQIVDRLGVRVSEQLAAVPGTENIRRELLTETQKYYEFFITQSADNALRRDRSMALTKAANIADQLGQHEQALKLYVEARGSLESLIDESPDQLEFPLEFQREVARCLNNEGVLLRRMGRTGESLQRLDQALKLHAELADRFGPAEFIDDLASAEANRAVVLEQRGQLQVSRMAYAAAIRSLREALALAPDNFKRAKRLSLSLHNLASAWEATDPERALACGLEAIEIQERLLDRRPEVITLRSDLALSYNNLGRLRALRREWDDAQDCYQRAIMIEARLSQLAPSVVRYRCDLAISLNNLGQLHLHLQRPENALAAFRRAASILDTLVTTAPRNVAYQSSLGAVKFNQGVALVALARHKEAKTICRQGLVHQQVAVHRAPEEPQFRQKLDFQSEQFKQLFNETRTN